MKKYKPMLAHQIDQPFTDENWYFEIKWDGYRALANVEKGEVSLYSRNELNLNNKYPEIIESLKTIKSDVVLDGELVLFDKYGLPDFQGMQNYRNNEDGTLVYFVFDILNFENHDLRRLPLERRKQILKKFLPEMKNVKYVDHLVGSGEMFFNEVLKMGLEGIVAKNKLSTYKSGARSKEWLKIKNVNRAEAVICGYTEPKSSRKYFGALLLGMYEKDKLVYVGNCGTGFTQDDLQKIYKILDDRRIEKSPFKNPIKGNIHWVKPELICEIKFAEWTKDGLLRQPIFISLRDDKPAKDVRKIDPKKSG